MMSEEEDPQDPAAELQELPPVNFNRASNTTIAHEIISGVPIDLSVYLTSTLTPAQRQAVGIVTIAEHEDCIIRLKSSRAGLKYWTGEADRLRSELRAKTEECERLRTALQPFADRCRRYERDNDKCGVYHDACPLELEGSRNMGLTVGDLRRAAAAFDSNFTNPPAGSGDAGKKDPTPPEQGEEESCLETVEQFATRIEGYMTFDSMSTAELARVLARREKVIVESTIAEQAKRIGELEADAAATGDVLDGILGFLNRCAEGNICMANDVALKIEQLKARLERVEKLQRGMSEDAVVRKSIGDFDGGMTTRYWADRLESALSPSDAAADGAGKDSR